MALDTAIFIYALEENLRYGSHALSLLQWVERGKLKGIASDLVLAELMVKPLKMGRTEVAERYERELPNFPNLSFVPLSREVVVAAARLRASVGLGLLDALHLSAALEAGAEVFFTNDGRLRKANLGLDVHLLSDLDGM